MFLCFSQHLFRFVESHLSSRLTMVWSSTVIFLNDVAIDRICIVVVFLKLCDTPFMLQISPATARNAAAVCEGVTVWALKLLGILHKVR